MSLGQHAGRRPLRVAPAWVGAARPGAPDTGQLPVREAVWIWSVRRYCRVAVWALPAAALLHGWAALGVRVPPGPLPVRLAAGWLGAVAMTAVAGLLAGTRTRRTALAGLLVGLAGATAGATAAPVAGGAGAATGPLLAAVAAAAAGTGWLLLGWAVFRSGRVNPADGVLLMLAAGCIGAGGVAPAPLRVAGALLLLAAGAGLAWTAHRLVPRA